MNVTKPILAVFAIVTALSGTPAYSEDKVLLHMKDSDGQNESFKLSLPEFKAGLVKAVKNGLITIEDAQKILSTLEDQRVLRDQFNFIQDQQRRMVSSVGSLML